MSEPAKVKLLDRITKQLTDDNDLRTLAGFVITFGVLVGLIVGSLMGLYFVLRLAAHILGFTF
jgi:hypothetical protein